MNEKPINWANAPKDATHYDRLKQKFVRIKNGTVNYDLAGYWFPTAKLNGHMNTFGKIWRIENEQ